LLFEFPVGLFLAFFSLAYGSLGIAAIFAFCAIVALPLAILLNKQYKQGAYSAVTPTTYSKVVLFAGLLAATPVVLFIVGMVFSMVGNLFFFLNF